MGNSAKIIGKHYRRVMSLAESEALFSILPPEDAEAEAAAVVILTLTPGDEVRSGSVPTSVTGFCPLAAD